VRAFDLQLELSHVTPRVWRIIRVPANLRLDDLHHAIQAVMGWDDFHPHVFEIGDKEYGPRPEDLDDDADDEFRETSAWAGEGKELSVGQALRDAGSRFTYIYDFADDWRVQVSATGEADVADDAAVICVAGEHAGPQLESRDLDPFTVDAANTRLRKALRPRATPQHPAGPGASSDQQLLAHLSLVVLLLGSRPTRHGTREAWKNLRVEILDSLLEAGLIDTDPQRKSVTLTDAGIAHAQRLLQRLRAL
jgi:hypothetical protein